MTFSNQAVRRNQRATSQVADTSPSSGGGGPMETMITPTVKAPAGLDLLFKQFDGVSLFSRICLSHAVLYFLCRFDIKANKYQRSH